MGNSGDATATDKKARMRELFTHKVLMDRIDELSVRELLKYALNFVHEESVGFTYPTTTATMWCKHAWTTSSTLSTRQPPRMSRLPKR